MEKKLEIKKLADVVVWADNEIEELKDALYEEEFEDCDEAKDLEVVKKVVLEAINRHKTYTNALNQDIADKAAKIDLLEKEIEGRKEGYTALKELMDTKYIPIDEHNRIVDQFKEEVKKLNKCIMNKNESINTGNEAIINLRKEIGAHEEENARLSEKIIELKRSFNNLKEEMANRYIPIETHNDICKTYEINDTSLKKQVEYLKKELNETCTCKELDLKGHQSRETALVNTLADKNDEIKKLKETIEELKKENMDHFKRRENDIVNQAKCISELKDEVTQYKELVDGLNKDLNYWKDQERIRTNQLRATENKVEELHGSINRLTLNCRSKNTEIARLTKEHADIRHELAKRTAESEFNEEDDHGRAGFKKYIEWLIEEEERAVPERFKARLNEEITEIFEKEEETEVKGVGRTSSGRYPWGAKVNDIPCGEDSIE